ncbi:MAG: PQQ-binding-like beta-propeller repeat protein, partial [Phycisphaeraceae bacterium]
TTPANLLPLEARIVLVDGESIRSFTSWSRAAARLRERMAETPADPSPALALAQLAARRGERQIIIDGVDQALTALRTAQRAAAERDTDQAQRVQQRTFAQVLDLARHEALDRLDQSAELREMLFDRVAMITSGPAQEVAYHLAVGRFLAAQRPREAVEHLQVVLADEVLSAQLYEAAPVSRQAGLEANQRLRALIEKHGRAIYATYEQRAARELERLAAQRADTEALIALAERYPLAAAASEALVRAAGQLAERDRLPAAVEQLRRARERAPTPAQRGRVVGQTAALYQAHGEPGRAIAWLHRLQREHPEVAPVRDGEPVSIDDWLSQLERMEPGAGSLPALALPLDQPRLVSGRLLAAPREHWAMAQRDVLLVERDGMLQRYEPGELALRWQREATFDQARLVGADERLLLLWSPRRHELIALDDATGEPAWAKLDATALLEEVGDARDRAAARAADRRRFEDLLQQRPVRLNRGQPMQREQDGDDEAQRFAVVGASSVALADHMGRVVGVDRRRGEVRWQLMSAIERITHARVRHDTLALAGVIGPGADTATGAIAVLDLRTGERIMPVIEDKQIPRWIGFAGDRLLLVASDDRITAYRLGSGAVAWRARVTDTALADVGWASERLVMLRDERGVGHLFDAETGERRQRLHLDAQLGRRAVSIDPVEQRWYVHTTDGLTCLDGSGAVQWRDGITEGPFAALTHLVTREHIVLLTQRRAAVGGDDAPAPPWVIRPGEAPIRERIEPAQPEPEQPDADDAEVGEADEAERFRHHLYLLDRRTGALVAEHPLGPLPHGLSAEGAAAQQNRLIVPTAGQTLVVPGGDAASN